VRDACNIVGPDPQGDGASWRFGPSTLTLFRERGDWILRLRTDMGSVEQLTVIPAWRGCRDWEGQKLDRCVLFCHPGETELDDSATGSDSVLNPLQFYGVERVRQANYNTAARQLDLHWDNKTVLTDKQVPEEVYRRLCSAPNPTTYWEVRIAEEYPKAIRRSPSPVTPHPHRPPASSPQCR
jgi:hypothetical protein